MISTDKGGIVEGKTHEQCDDSGCGEKFRIVGTDMVVEMEQGESVIVPEAFDSECFRYSFCENPANYVMRGTVSQIASAINALGGGTNWDSRAVVYKNGRRVKSPRRLGRKFKKPFYVEGGSVVINRTNMYDPSEYQFSGTPYEIASKINSLNGNGVELDNIDQNGEQFKDGGRISPSESATLFEVGTIRKSDNDGKKWIIKEDKNGRKSWKRYKDPAETTPPKKRTRKNIPEPTPEEQQTIEAINQIDSEIEDLSWLYGQGDDAESKKEIRNTSNDLRSLQSDLKADIGFNPSDAMYRYFNTSAIPVADVANISPDEYSDTVFRQDFRKWFGDWSEQLSIDSPMSGQVSEVIKEDGSPILVYHGTTSPKAFSRFDMGKFPVMYFAQNKEYAQWFANLGSGIIYPAFLNIRYLFDLSDLGIKDVNWSTIVKNAKSQNVILPKTHPISTAKVKKPAWGWLRHDLPHQTLIKAVKEAGYTGMKHVENNPSDIIDGKQNTTDAYMIFSSDQVKVPIKGGGFAPFIDVMYLQEGGNITSAKSSIQSKLKKLKR